MRRTIVIIALALVSIGAVWSMSERSTPPSGRLAEVPEHPAPPTDAIAAVRTALQSDRKVRDFVYDPDAAVQWQIGVVNDGSSRVGYANYICELLAENGAAHSRTQVRIVDIARIANGATFRAASLGHVACSDRRVIVP